MKLSKGLFSKNGLLLFLIISVAFFLRFYKLSSLPVQLNHDEVSQLYDGMSLLKTGKDIYGNSWPFIFVSIGDYKPPFYTYASLPFIYIFNGSEVSIRILGALFGVILVYAVYFLSEGLFGKKEISLISSFLTAVSPFAIHFSRKGFEGVVGLSLVIFALGFFFRSFLSRGNGDRNFVLGCIFLALSMYTYFSYFLLVPFLLLFFIFLKYRFKKIFPWRSVFVFFVLTLPLFLMVVSDKNSKNRVSAVSIVQDQVLGNLLRENLDPNESFYSLEKLAFIGKYSLARYINQFNPTFLFVNGLDMSNRDPVDVGFFYFYEFIFVFIGLFSIRSYLKKREWFLPLLIIVLIAMVPSSLSFEDHSPHRVLLSLQIIVLFSAVGIYKFFLFLFNGISKFYLRFSLFLFLIIIFVWHFVYFWILYSVVFPIDKSEFIQYPYKLVGQLAGKYYYDYDLIVFDPRFGEYYPWVGGAASYYLAYYSGFPVEKMQSEYRIKKEGDLTVVSFGKYEIRDIVLGRDKNMRNTLFIASPWVIGEVDINNFEIIDIVYSLKGHPAFYFLSNKNL